MKGIRSDAGELLIYAYINYRKGNWTESGPFQEESGWQLIRCENAVRYLVDRGLVKAHFYAGGGFIIERLFPEAIDMVEDEQEFQHTFGFELNFMVFKFTWELQKAP